jgi:hypothetical protein
MDFSRTGCTGATAKPDARSTPGKDLRASRQARRPACSEPDAEVSYSFLIHAGQDKARLAPIVQHLIDAGIRLWIDDPYHEDLELRREQILRLAGYIVPGADWPRQRDLALQQAGSVLVAISEASVDQQSAEVHAELAIAEFREAHEGIPVFPLALSSAELGRSAALIGRRQSFKTFVETGVSAFELTDRGERAMEELIDALKNAASERPLARSLQAVSLEKASPYFADRTAQSQDLHAALRRCQEGAPRLVLPIITGSYEDRPDKFALNQLPCRLLPRVLRTAGCEAITLAWPHCALHARSRAIELLREELYDVDPAPACAVFYTQPPPEQLGSREALAACLSLWADFWAEPENLRRAGGSVPLIDLRIEAASAPQRLWQMWKRNVAREPRLAVSAIAASLEPHHSCVRLVPLPPFTSVTWHCVEDWLREEVSPVLGEYRTAQYRRLLQRYFHRDGMTMESWARRAHEVFVGLNSLGR